MEDTFSKCLRMGSILGLSALALTACNGDGSLGEELGRGEVTGTSQEIPNENPDVGTPPGGGDSSTRLGATCTSSNTSKICLSVRYVVYKNSAGKAVVSSDQALTNLAQINSVWSACGIAFEIGEYLAVDPRDYALNYNTSTNSELNSIRRNFRSDNKLLVATTGTWSGSLGAGSANAWAMMPGGTPDGIVLEAPVGDYPNIIAHELGHYLNLNHVSDSASVMSSTIYQGSTKLSASQCNAARSAAQYYWFAMYR